MLARHTLTLILAMNLIQSLGNGAAFGRDAYTSRQGRPYNGPYQGRHLERIAFPLGGIGAGMVCLEGGGCLSHVSVRHQPEIFNEPKTFAAVYVKTPRPGLARSAYATASPSWT
jgi:hypothetical protein